MRPFITLFSFAFGASLGGLHWMATHATAGDVLPIARSVPHDRANRVPVVEATLACLDSAPVARSRPKPPPAPTGTNEAPVVWGSVTDRNGQPIGGAQIVLKESSLVVARSDSRGVWAAPLSADAEGEINIVADGFVTQSHALHDHGAPTNRLHSVLQPAPIVSIRFDDENGEPYPIFDPVLSMIDVAATHELPILGTCPDPAESLGRYRPHSLGAVPHNVDPGSHGAIALRSTPPMWLTVRIGRAVLGTRLIRDEQSTPVTLDRNAIDAIRGTVRVALADHRTGAAVVDNTRLRHPTSGREIAPRVEGGTLVFEGVLPGSWTLERFVVASEDLRRDFEIGPRESMELGSIRIRPRFPSPGGE